MFNYDDFEKKYADLVDNLINEDPNKEFIIDEDWKLPEYNIADEFPIAQTRPVIIPITRAGKTWAPFTWNISDIMGVDTEEAAIKKSFIGKINGIL